MEKATGGDKTADPVFVLIAEDDSATAELIACVVEQVGATPLVAYDGQQALELASTCTPTVVVTDLMMPRMSGDALIAALREEWGANLPVILISAAPYAQLLMAGADAVLSKPFDLMDLDTLLNYYLAARSPDRSTMAEMLPRAQPWERRGFSALPAHL